VPLTCGAWQGREEKVDPTIKKYLAAEQMLARSYTRSGLRVGFSATFGTQWRSLHSPAGCYPSQGWQTISRRPVTIPFDGAPGFAGPLRAEELFVEKSQNYRLVLYLYVFPGGTTANWVEQCLRVARSGVGGGGVVLILDAPASLESRGQVEKDLSDLLTSIFPHVVRGWGNGAAG
jgi:EpsI family protein